MVTEEAVGLDERGMAEELDKQLERALLAASLEAQAKGMINTAEGFRSLRDYVMQTRTIILDRIKEYGIITMREEQQKQLLAMVASAMVEKAIKDTHDRTTQQQQAFWNTKTAKISAVSGVAMVVLTALASIYTAFVGTSHPIVHP